MATGGTYEGSGIPGKQGFAGSRKPWKHSVSSVVHCMSASPLGNAVVPSAPGLTKVLAFLGATGVRELELSFNFT